MPVALDHLCTLENWESRYPSIPKRLIQNWYYMNKYNFRDRCVFKVGGRILIDVEQAARWIEEWRNTASDQDELSKKELA